MSDRRDDRRLTPANGRVAAEHLRGQVDAPRYSDGVAYSVAEGVVDLRRAPGGARDRQLLLAAPVRVYDEQDGWAFVQAQDGYVGYVPRQALGAPVEATHRIGARASHVYSAADIKSPERMALSHGARLAVLPGDDARMAQTAMGFVPRAHLVAVDHRATDPVAEAEKLLGTPYLWGGNSAFGIDCSGLVQMALHACGQDCPGDSDMQAAALGVALPADTPPRRGDLLFWKGHVAWVAAPDLLLHANAHSMCVAFEGLADAVARIAAQGEGSVTRHARLDGTDH